MSESKQVDRYDIITWLDSVCETVKKRRSDRARETAAKLRNENITHYNWFRHHMDSEMEDGKIIFDAAWKFATDAVKADEESASPKGVNFFRVFDAAYDGAVMLVSGREANTKLSSMFDENLNLIIH